MSEYSVKYERSNLTIAIERNGQWIYEIDLEETNTPAELLDWIFQIHGKSWCTPELLHNLLTVIDEACEEIFGKSPQGVFVHLALVKRQIGRLVNLETNRKLTY